MKSKQPFRKQITSPELRDELLRFIQSKFYQQDALGFAKDRPQLLKLVILKFAHWLDERGVTLPSNRFLEIVRDKILMEAVRYGKIEEVKYRPGYLGYIVEQHIAHHGDEYYEEAKSIRTVTENAVMIAGELRKAPAPDPVRELAKAATLLKVKKPKAAKVEKSQMDLF